MCIGSQHNVILTLSLVSQFRSLRWRVPPRLCPHSKRPLGQRKPHRKTSQTRHSPPVIAVWLPELRQRDYCLRKHKRTIPSPSKLFLPRAEDGGGKSLILALCVEGPEMWLAKRTLVKTSQRLNLWFRASICILYLVIVAENSLLPL